MNPAFGTRKLAKYLENRKHFSRAHSNYVGRSTFTEQVEAEKPFWGRHVEIVKSQRSPTGI